MEKLMKYFLLLLLLVTLTNQQDFDLSNRLEPPPGQRCSGRNYQGRRCCTPENPCDEGEGDCDGPGDGGQHDGHAGCKGDLLCGSNNCKQFGAYFHPKDDCCEKAPKSKLGKESPSIIDLLKDKNTPTFFKPIAHRCAGREIDEGRCCTSEEPCKHGEGDCDNDAECESGLKCGNNNCLQFAAYFHPKDDCCFEAAKNSDSENVIYEWGPWEEWTVDKTTGEKKRLRYQIKKKESTTKIEEPQEPLKLDPSIPFEPAPGQRCAGRNFQGRRCCTPENQCDEGEGDCDGPGDGGQHDGHAGCKGDLVCGSNNCKKFGHYYHEKDDCCERP